MKSNSIRLSETDLQFLLDALEAESEEKDKLKRLVREDQALFNAVIGDEKVFSKVIHDRQSFRRISPQLYYEILLRKTSRQFKEEDYTIEPNGKERVPILDPNEGNDLLLQDPVLTYLSEMLASFTKTENHTISYRVGNGISRKIRNRDLDIDRLKEYAEWMDEEQKLVVYKKIGDLCLFIVGVFPEYVVSQRFRLNGKRKLRFPGQMARSMEEYEKKGRKFYESAAEHCGATTTDLSEVFSLLHEHFDVAKKSLNFLSKHYLNSKRTYLFGVEHP